MKPVLTPEESARLDAAAAERMDELMERAGYAVADAAIRMGAGYGSRVGVLAGKGNNGGDGYVAARQLRRRGVAVAVRAFGAPRAGTAAERALLDARAAGVAVAFDGAPPEVELVIDAVFGVGFHGRLPDDVAGVTEREARVLAVDVPSGLDAGTGQVDGAAFTAERTVTFHTLKPGHLLGEGPERCGEVEVVDIGLVGGDSVFVVCEEADAPRPSRPRTAHKWSAGSVVVVGGSPGLTGAPLLTAEAALHFGAGAVTIFCPAGLQGVFASLSPGVMSRGVGNGTHFAAGDAEEVLTAAQRFDVMVVGPGLGLSQEAFVHTLLAGWSGRLLVDADGLNALGGPAPLEARPAPTVLTPHAGELARIIGGTASWEAARDLAAKTATVVLFKGAPTFVLGDDTWAVTSGGSELATIGTGDVLSGMVAALWGRGLDGATAARSGAYWHGRAGADLAQLGTVTAHRLSSHIGRFAW